LRAGAVAAVLVVVAAAAVASSGGVAARPLVGEGGGGAWGQDSRAPLQTSRAFNIAHRGSNGELPEETAAAYARAIDEGADFIEADIEATSDGHLVCFHDTTLDDTTDVADHPEFAGRRRTLEVQWANVTGYFISTCTFRTVCHHSAQCSDFISSYRCVDRKHRL
jgi:glycerophosphoryl diester phosphodiesterase